MTYKWRYWVAEADRSRSNTKTFARAFARTALCLAILGNPAEVLAQSCCNPATAPNCERDGWYINPDTCQCETADSPIIVDLTGSGLRLTSASAGVRFDIRGNGRMLQIAWTRADLEAAFLVLDRNGNGRIDSGKELFGNYTPQSPTDSPNGFLALSEYDKTANGGNGDGIIDARDGIYPSLRLWIDSNHNGFSEPTELYSLDVKGVSSISLEYKSAARRDRFGNRFLYRAKVGMTRGLLGTPYAYDVFFATASSAAIGLTDTPGAIDGAKSPDLIPDEVAFGIFFRVAACPSNANSLQRKKCNLARLAVGLTPDNDSLLKAQLDNFLAEVSSLDQQITKSVNGSPIRSQLLIKRNQVIKDRITAVRSALAANGSKRLDEHMVLIKSRIKFIPRN